MASQKPKQELDPQYDHYDFPSVAPEPRKGHPGYTTPQEDAQVHQLRMMLEQMGYKDRLDTLTLVSFPHLLKIIKSLTCTVTFPKSTQIRCQPRQTNVSQRSRTSKNNY
jgi:hypothetical protein